jgi:hypothetical protein
MDESIIAMVIGVVLLLFGAFGTGTSAPMPSWSPKKVYPMTVMDRTVLIVFGILFEILGISKY